MLNSKMKEGEYESMKDIKEQAGNLHQRRIKKEKRE